MQITLAIGQIAPKKGDYTANINQIGALFAQVHTLTPRPDVLVLPETVLSGYFLEGGVRDVARPAGTVARDLQAAYADACGPNAPPLDVIVGFYERHRDRFYNSAMYVELGPIDQGPTTKDQSTLITTEGAVPLSSFGLSSLVFGPTIRHVHRKVFLPTYGVFDEGRFVEAGRQFAAFDTRWGRAAMLICEDAWHGISGTIAALDGAQVVFVPSASPARGTSGPRPANVEHWSDLMHRISDEHGVYTVLAQLVGFEGGKGFPGCSQVLGPHGDVRASAPLWDPVLLTVSIDLADLPLARADQPLLSDLETTLPHLSRELARAERGEPALVRWDGALGQGSDVGARSSRLAGGQGSDVGARSPRPLAEGQGGRGDLGQRRATSQMGAADHLHVPARPLARSPERAASGAPLPPSAERGAPERAAASGNPILHITPTAFDPNADLLKIDAGAVRRWLVAFLRDEVTRRRGFTDVVVALSGGVDSALVVYLCAEAFGPEHVTAIRMPYRTSSRESLDHAQLVVDALGVRSATVDISAAVDGYANLDPEIDGRRKGNIMARTRMIVLFDYSQKLGCIPIGTGNKTERLFGYYTWHADDSPPVNPLGDLFKSQVWDLAREMGVPPVIVEKPASADLIVGQTDESDFGISYPLADKILHFLLNGYPPERIATLGYTPEDIALVKRRLDSTHWKRHLPSIAMLSPTAIGEYYLRPLDY